MGSGTIAKQILLSLNVSNKNFFALGISLNRSEISIYTDLITSIKQSIELLSNGNQIKDKPFYICSSKTNKNMDELIKQIVAQHN